MLQAKDPEQVFTGAAARELVQKAGVSLPLDIEKLRAGLIEAAEIYAAERTNDGNAVHREIAKLGAAAQHRRFKVVAEALAGLSSSARDCLCQRDGPALPPLPQSGDLFDPTKREQACIAVVDRCEIGGRMVRGRKRPSGRRSWTWEPDLWAPKLTPHPEIRDAERTFIMWLQVAWLEATGKKVPVTAHRDNPGPFARLAQAALALLGAPNADAVQLINDLERLRDGPLSRRKT